MRCVLIYIILIFSACKSAELKMLEKYTHNEISEKKQISEQMVKDAKKLDLFISKIPNAPEPVLIYADHFDLSAIAHEKYCPNKGCYIVIEGKELLRNFDFLSLKKNLEDKLDNKSVEIAFSGFSSGEIFITTKQKLTAKNSSKYYQYRLITSECKDSSEWNAPCRFYGSAYLISIQSKNKLYYETDKTCLELEKITRDKILEAFEKLRKN